MSRRPTEENWDTPPKPRPRRRNDSGIAIALTGFIASLILYFVFKAGVELVICVGVAAILYILVAGRGR